MHIRVQDASRYYLYAPVSLMDSNGRDVNGELLRSRGLLGARDYTYQELSDYRPAELMEASPWVSNPRTEEQTRYSQAEAVYRRFVYDNYTALDAETNDLMQRIFWDGYDSEASGIYSAVSHVRDVLKTQVSYDEAAADVPENADPVQYFLTMSRRGNAALYASATVQALHGYKKAAPEQRARVVERYLYRMLHILGVDASLGWNTAALDEKIAACFIDVEPGEYTRVCRLIERTIYGGDAPDLREERAMQSFLFKLAASAREEPLHTRLRLRYTCPLSDWSYKQNTVICHSG